MKIQCASSAVILAIAGSAYAERFELNDAELANVSAGYYATSGSTRESIVVSGGTVANLHDDTSVMLDTDTQSNTNAVALVNSSRSNVANGSNIRDGQVGMAEGASVLQQNHIRQQRRAAAYFGDWQLHGMNVERHRTETFDSEFDGGILPQVIPFTGSVVTDTITTEVDKDGNKKTTPSTSTIELTEELKIGRGVAMAGEIELTSGAGGFMFSEVVDGSMDTTSTTSFSIGVWKFKHTFKESTSVHAEKSGGISGGIELQPFSLRAKGVFCQALIGSCLPYTGHYSSDSHTEETDVFPAHLQGASAGQIVMSDGELNNVTDSYVTLEGHAQNGLAAFHTVNASSSQIANSLNVSRSFAPALIPQAIGLQQNNLISQRQ